MERHGDHCGSSVTSGEENGLTETAIAGVGRRGVRQRVRCCHGGTKTTGFDEANKLAEPQTVRLDE